MGVSRVVRNITVEDMRAAQAFYGDLLGMTIAMDHGWITTFSGAAMPARRSVSRSREGQARRCRICRSRWMISKPSALAWWQQAIVWNTAPWRNRGTSGDFSFGIHSES